eukprot:275098_1
MGCILHKSHESSYQSLAGTLSESTLPNNLSDAIEAQSLELSDVERLCVNDDMTNPLVVCITTKSDPKTCLINAPFPEYLRIIHALAHRDITKHIKDIIWKDISCDNPAYDGLIITLQCVCSFSGETLKFFYDRTGNARHIDELRKDIIEHFDDIPLLLDYSNAIQFDDGRNDEKRLGAHTDHSRPNGQLVNWKPPKKRSRAKRGDAKAKYQQTQHETPSANDDQDDAKEIQQTE